MTWTYSGDPSKTVRDAVRFLVGDTDRNDQLVTDEEIAYAYLEEGNNVRMAAARVARSLAGFYSRKVDKSVGDLKVTNSQRVTHYLEMAKKLETDSSITDAFPYAGGISDNDKDSVESNSDRISPSFVRGMHDYPVDQDKHNNTQDICE